MAAGFQPNLNFINQNAGQLVISLRNNLDALKYFNAGVQNLGHDGLVALGMSTQDATALLALFSNLDCVRQAMEGEAYTGPALPHNFVADSIPFWGCQ